MVQARLGCLNDLVAHAGHGKLQELEDSLIEVRLDVGALVSFLSPAG